MHGGFRFSVLSPELCHTRDTVVTSSPGRDRSGTRSEG